MKLKRFQERLLDRCFNPAYKTVGISMPRGNGKSFLAALVLGKLICPSPQFQPGAEQIMLAGSLAQARIVFNYLRLWLEDTGDYRWLDSASSLGVTHKASGASVRVRSSNPKTALGIVNTQTVILDEPGSLELRGGESLISALETAQGKPGSHLKLIIVGTLAPAPPDSWWPKMVLGGSHGRTSVTLFQGDPKRWDDWSEIKKANPLLSVDPDFAKTLKEERDAALVDSRLAARFKSYRLNSPARDESETLLTVDDWKLALARDVPERSGQPIVGVDLGQGRSWSAAVGIYPNGRIEAIAVAPGIPSVAEQEKRDRVPSGTYEKLIDTGRLYIADGLRVQLVSQIADLIGEHWAPRLVVADRFRAAELQDAVSFCEVSPRVSRWSEAAQDIRALRGFIKDGPFAIEGESAKLLTVSLAKAIVKSDDAGNTRLAKLDPSNSSARDDVAAAFLLGSGAHQREQTKSPEDCMPFFVPV